LSGKLALMTVDDRTMGRSDLFRPAGAHACMHQGPLAAQRTTPDCRNACQVHYTGTHAWGRWVRRTDEVHLLAAPHGGGIHVRRHHRVPRLHNRILFFPPLL
jgi:hypothetical protein